jgi:hypothetical protein
MTPGTIDDTARAIARARWLERRCFEVLGAWVVSTPEPEVKLALARQSHHHAWHAELFDRVWPSASGLDVAHHDASPPPWEGVIAHLAALTTTADRLAGAYRVVLPAKVEEYDRWYADADVVRDAPLRRWLGFVLADERADLAEGAALVERTPGAESAPGRAAMEAVLAAAGPLLG